MRFIDVSFRLFAVHHHIHSQNRLMHMIEPSMKRSSYVINATRSGCGDMADRDLFDHLMVVVEEVRRPYKFIFESWKNQIGYLTYRLALIGNGLNHLKICTKNK